MTVAPFLDRQPAAVLAAALAYAKRGWPVFPTLNKNPIGRLVPHGFKSASTEASTIERWWTEEPSAQVSIAIPAGHLVVDVDAPDATHPDGFATLAELEREHGNLPPTLTAESGRGGIHPWFVLPAGAHALRQRDLGPGVQTRVAGRGYVVAPPSVHQETGRLYRWRDEGVPMAEAPAWLVKLLSAERDALPSSPAKSAQPGLAPARTAAYGATALERACEVLASASRGERNTTLAREAYTIGQLVAAGHLDQREAVAALRGAVAGWDASAKRRTAKTLEGQFSRGLEQPREPRPRTDVPRASDQRCANDAADVDDVEREAIAAESQDAEARPSVAEPLRGLEYLSKLALVGRAAIEARAVEPIDFVWKDIAVAGTIIVIAGGVGEGKTTLLFLILLARMSVDAPMQILGRTVFPAPHGKFVVLIEGEHGEGSTARKLVRSREILGLDSAALDRVIVVARKNVLVGSPEWGDVTRLVAAGLVSDVALDTLARVSPRGGDSNSEGDQVAIFDTIAKTIETAPCEADKPTFWVAAHRRKGGEFDLDAVSGSAQRTGQADSVLLVVGERVGGRITKSTVGFWKLREDPDDYPEPVSFSVIVSPEGRRSIEYQDASQGEPDEDQPLEVTLTDILLKGAQTKNALANTTGRSWADVDKAIGNLFSAKTIRTTVIKVRGKPCKALELTPAARKNSTADGQNLARLWADSMISGSGPTLGRLTSGENHESLQNKAIGGPTSGLASSAQWPDPDAATLKGCGSSGQPSVQPLSGTPELELEDVEVSP